LSLIDSPFFEIHESASVKALFYFYVMSPFLTQAITNNFLNLRLIFENPY